MFSCENHYFYVFSSNIILCIDDTSVFHVMMISAEKWLVSSVHVSHSSRSEKSRKKIHVKTFWKPAGKNRYNGSSRFPVAEFFYDTAKRSLQSKQECIHHNHGSFVGVLMWFVVLETLICGVGGIDVIGVDGGVVSMFPSWMMSPLHCIDPLIDENDSDIGDDVISPGMRRNKLRIIQKLLKMKWKIKYKELFLSRGFNNSLFEKRHYQRAKPHIIDNYA